MVDITGDGSANLLFGSLVDDLIRGKAGDDYINGRDGDDRLKGNNGQDVIVDGAGEDRMWGGNHADTFVLVADGEKDRIMDFEDGSDLIDLTAWGVTDVADLTFQALSNGQMKITFGDEILQIKQKGGAALSVSDFDATDFVLAPSGARTIDFEALSILDPSFGAPIELMKPGYGGVSWSEQFYFVEEDDLTALGRSSGAENRAGGGNVFATGGFGAEVWFEAGDNFDFEQVEIGAAYNDGLGIRIVGMDNGQIVGSQWITVDTTTGTTLQLDDNIFDSVDQVIFSSSGGTLNSAYASSVAGGDTTHFYIDDLVIA